MVPSLELCHIDVRFVKLIPFLSHLSTTTVYSIMESESSSREPITGFRSCMTRRWRNHLTQRTAVIVLWVFGLVFIGVGIGLKYGPHAERTYMVQYDETCKNVAGPCTVKLNVEKDMKGKIAMLYKLQGFYQNHRRMFNSKSYTQMEKWNVSSELLESCTPMLFAGEGMEQKDVLLPCGLLAWSFFTDYYVFRNTSVATFSDQNIALESDRKYLFHSPVPDGTEGVRHLLANTDFPGEAMNEHFIVWMRAAAMPTFLKLFAVCEDCNIPAGEYSIDVRMHYPVSMHKGGRYIVLTEMSAFGSHSNFLYMSYLVVGVQASLFGLIFMIHMLVCPRPYGDLSSIWQPQTNDGSSVRGELLNEIRLSERDGENEHVPVD